MPDGEGFNVWANIKSAKTQLILIANASNQARLEASKYAGIQALFKRLEKTKISG